MYIKATGEKSADMVTDGGAIYVTENQEYNWKAPVQETVSATLNWYVMLDTCCKLNLFPTTSKFASLFKCWFLVAIYLETCNLSILK